MIPRFSRRGRRVRGGTILPERHNSALGCALVRTGGVGRSRPRGQGPRQALEEAGYGPALPPAGAGAAPLRPRTLRA